MTSKERMKQVILLRSAYCKELVATFIDSLEWDLLDTLEPFETDELHPQRIRLGKKAYDLLPDSADATLVRSVVSGDQFW